MIDICKIRNGDYDGKYVWICDFRFSDFNKKPLRKVLPQKVLVQNNGKVEKDDFYGNSHFVALNKDGTLSTRIIKVFDNTANAIPVNAFEKEADCRAFFRNQCVCISRQLEDWYKHMRDYFAGMKFQLKNLQNDNSDI